MNRQSTSPQPGTSPISKLTFLLLSLALGLISPAPGQADPPSRPHIVLIMVDDMGYGDPGCYNPESKIPTPHIDALAQSGMRFTDAHAPGPLCHLSRYGLLTGRYPFRGQPERWREQPVIEEGATTLPSMLKSRGYRTAMVGKWHLGFDEANGYSEPMPGGPIDRGFNHFFGIRASTDIPPYFYIRDNRAVAPPTVPIEAGQSPDWSPIQGKFWREGLIAPGMKLEDVLPRFTEEAIEVIQTHGREGGEAPLMLYLAYPAPHTPWLPSEPFAQSSRAGLYGDFMTMVDAMTGQVLEALDDAGLAEESLVIFTSDNGPVWYEDDVKRFGHDSSGGLRGMKADAWEGGHRMPFIVRWPTRVAPGTVSKATLCFTDLLATCAALTGYKLKPGEGPDSFDFSPILLGKQPEDLPFRPHLAMRSGSGLKTIRQGEWKWISGLGSGGFSEPRRVRPEPGGPEGQLYNLAEDPDESENLYLKEPETVERLRKLWEEVAEGP